MQLFPRSGHDGAVCVAGHLSLSLLSMLLLLVFDTLQIKSLLVYDRQALLDFRHDVLTPIGNPDPLLGPASIPAEASLLQ